MNYCFDRQVCFLSFPSNKMDDYLAARLSQTTTSKVVPLLPLQQTTVLMEVSI